MTVHAPAETKALELPRRRSGERLDVFDLSRVLVRCDRMLDEVLQLARERLVTGSRRAEHDVGLDELPSLLVGDTDHGTFRDRWMLEQRVLDLGSGDVVARGHDHVIGARLVPEVAFVVDDEGVAGNVPTAPHIAELPLVRQVAATRRAAHGETADRAGRRRAVVLIENAGPVAGYRSPRRAGTNVVARRGDEDVDHLGGADAVDDAMTGRLLPC